MTLVNSFSALMRQLPIKMDHCLGFPTTQIYILTVKIRDKTPSVSAFTGIVRLKRSSKTVTILLSVCHCRLTVVEQTPNCLREESSSWESFAAVLLTIGCCLNLWGVSTVSSSPKHL